MALTPGGPTCSSCHAELASDRRSELCGPCERKLAELSGSAPTHPSEFWNNAEIQDALRTQHFGHVLHAYREAHTPTIKQAQLGEWLGLTQGQISRIEHAKDPITDLAKLTRWATTLHIPLRLLWFHPQYSLDAWALGPQEPRMGSQDSIEGDHVNRRQLLKATGVVAATAAVGATSSGAAARTVTGRECAELLAWEMWQQRTTAVHYSDLPMSVANYLGAASPQAAKTSGIPTLSPDGLIVADRNGYYSFVQPALVDAFVAQHIYTSINAGKHNLLATAQTTHETDLVLQKLVERDEASLRLLGRWMRSGSASILQVNSAGILAKTGNRGITDATITALKVNSESRRLYMTAVLDRVLDLGWDNARRLASLMEESDQAVKLSDNQIYRLADEIQNARDGAARWCSVVALGLTGSTSNDYARTKLHHALQKEPCVENLRAVGNVLVGHNPLTI